MRHGQPAAHTLFVGGVGTGARGPRVDARAASREGEQYPQRGEPMNTMKLIAMPALAALVLAACGGGGGLAPAMPETPAAVPVVVAEPEREDEPEPVAAPAVVPEPLPDPATLLRSHERLSLPDGFNAVLADEAMYLLANIPYREAAGGGGAGLAAASVALQAGAYALYTAERTEAYRADHASMTWVISEKVRHVNPELTTWLHSHDPLISGRSSGQRCIPARGECIVPQPAAPGVNDAVEDSTSVRQSERAMRPVKVPIEDMPFVSGAMREGSEGVRNRGGVGLRYWSNNGAVPWLKYQTHPASESEHVSETWSGYGAWQQWSGFGLAMLAHNHAWDLYDSAWYFAVAGGDLTGSWPSREIEGTMTGAAVAAANDMSFIADGTATMTVRFPSSRDIRFSLTFDDWQGYRLTERGEIGLPIDVPANYAAAFSALGIPDSTKGWIRPDGTFGGGVTNGAFYGPGGVEAAGTFCVGCRTGGGVRATGVHGAWGVHKPDEPE